MKVTPVSKCLDKKLQMFGFEMPDLLAIFLLLSILNLVFGGHPYKMFFVWVPPLVLATALRIGKRNKPDNFLVHWLRFQMSPGVYSAFNTPSQVSSLPKRKSEVTL